MAEVGMSNARLAEIVGVDPATVSQWRSGKFPPSDENLAAVAQALGTSIVLLRYGVDDRSPDLVIKQPDGGISLVEMKRSGPPNSVREQAVAYAREFDLPRQFELMALAFEQEALKAGADKPFMRYARARLRDPALFDMYAGGHEARPLTEAEQRDDYAEVIDDLRIILKKRLKRLKEGERPKRKGDDDE